MSASLRYRLRLRHNCAFLQVALRELAARKALASRESTCTRMAAPSHCRRYPWLPQERLRPTAWAHTQTLPWIRVCIDFSRKPCASKQQPRDLSLQTRTRPTSKVRTRKHDSKSAFGSPPSRQLGKRTSGSCLSPAARCSWQPQMASTRQQRAILSRAPPSRCKQRRKELLQQVKSSESRGAVSLRVFK